VDDRDDPDEAAALRLGDVALFMFGACVLIAGLTATATWLVVVGLLLTVVATLLPLRTLRRRHGLRR
jgi:membrane protein implicated in regulation of membrane protease activity